MVPSSKQSLCSCNVCMDTCLKCNNHMAETSKNQVSPNDAFTAHVCTGPGCGLEAPEAATMLRLSRSESG